MSKGHIMVLRGLPTSGKTTYANSCVELVGRAVRVSRDDLRSMLKAHGKDQPPLAHVWEEQVTAIQRAIAAEAVRQGQIVVVDDMNLRPKYVRAWRRFAQAHGASFSVRQFEVDPAEARRRNKARRQRGERAVDDAVFDHLARYLQRDGSLLPVPNDPEDEPAEAPVLYDRPFSAPSCIVVDIDGTLALNTGRHIHDLTRVSEDALNDDVAAVISILSTCVVNVVYLSGREGTERCREATQAWLDDNQLPSGELFMRPEGDRRKDAIVKRELFFENVAKRYDVIGVFDDRDQVVRMWREIGLTCFQVAEGDF